MMEVVEESFIASENDLKLRVVERSAIVMQGAHGHRSC